MTKADTIRLLHAERCSVDEIAAAVGWRRSAVRDFLRHCLIRDRVMRAFRGWRGFPLSELVTSF